ncbi:hypothetical protein KKB40_01525 [Patescibacteria group bacterium]|nr:hypothetical protein [Patescibacteria group bacterium]
MVEFIILHVPRKPRFTDAQLQTFVDVLVSVGLVGFGTVAVPAFLEKGSFLGFIFGLVLSVVSWYIAVSIAGKILS